MNECKVHLNLHYTLITALITNSDLLHFVNEVKYHVGMVFL